MGFQIEFLELRLNFCLKIQFFEREKIAFLPFLVNRVFAKKLNKNIRVIIPLTFLIIEKLGSDFTVSIYKIMETMESLEKNLTSLTQVEKAQPHWWQRTSNPGRKLPWRDWANSGQLSSGTAQVGCHHELLLTFDH